MRIAIIDLGTNTCRLLLAEVKDGSLAEVRLRRSEVVRLGQGVDRTRRLDPSAVERAYRCLRGYATLVKGYAPHRCLLVATAAVRSATDGVAFLARAERELGLPWQVVDGKEEAALSFRGAVASLPPLPGRLLVFDIGGGSTELVIGRAADGGTPSMPGISLVCSLKTGAVQLTERFFAADPPTPGQRRAAVRHIRRLLATAVSPEERVLDAAVGVAGTMTTLMAHELRLPRYDRRQVHGRVLHLAAIEAAIRTFQSLTSAQRRQLPGIEPGREDVILAGALIAREICRLFGLSGAICSDADLLEGAALALAEGGEDLGGANAPRGGRGSDEGRSADCSAHSGHRSQAG
jgi:exopolyphosphatase/guanosine-5'-triphosphate,3'-diphosphate pyrophosphatase